MEAEILERLRRLYILPISVNPSFKFELWCAVRTFMIIRLGCFQQISFALYFLTIQVCSWYNCPYMSHVIYKVEKLRSCLNIKVCAVARSEYALEDFVAI